MKNILLSVLLLSNLTFATENYMGLYSIKIEDQELKNKFCKNNKNGDEFCMEYRLIYPAVLNSSNKKLVSSIKTIIKKKIKDFKKLNAKDKVLMLLSDEPDLTWSWEDNIHIKLYATTQTTFTLAIINYNYSGGAHGNRTVTYENYSIEDGKELELNDILVKEYSDKLNSIADRFYRERNKLSAKDSLTKIGWYGDNFILSDNFAIRREGLEFLYNPYEIKPHIAGITKFLLPYSRIASIMKSDK
jgi:hypothetical protein